MRMETIYPRLEELSIGMHVNMQEGSGRSKLSADSSFEGYDQYGNPIWKSAVNQEAAKISAPVNSLAISQPTVRRDPIEVTNWVREIKVSKADDRRVGLQLRGLDGGVFITYVEADSPAARAGLRFGDQVLKIHDQSTAGYTGTRAMKLIKNGQPTNIPIIIRDRPLERVITLTKNSQGVIGIKIIDGKITGVVQDSSAARNGVLINYQLVEVDGINVIGLDDNCIQGYLLRPDRSTVRITVMPSDFFEHIVKKVGQRYLENMDRSKSVAQTGDFK